MSKEIDRSGKSWTEGEIASLQYLSRLGTDYERIGNALGRSSDSVAMKASLLRKSGVDLPYKRRRRRTVTTTVEEEADRDEPEGNDQDRIASLEAIVHEQGEQLRWLTERVQYLLDALGES